MTSVEPLLFWGRSRAAWDLAQAELHGSGRTPPPMLAWTLGHGRNPVSQIREGTFLLVRRHKTKHKREAWLGLGQGILFLLPPGQHCGI